jgi:Ca2+-transporting ATPase
MLNLPPLNTLEFFQFFHALNFPFDYKIDLQNSLFSNPLLFFSLMFAIIAHIAIFHLPFMQLVFHTASLDLSTWTRRGNQFWDYQLRWNWIN